MGFSTRSFAAGAIVALVLGSGTAVAATGGKFILGQANSAGNPSTLSNPNGTALVLKSKAGTPSLRVNRPTKVPNLNADRLDGLDGSALALRKGRTGARFSDGPLEGVDLDEDGVNDSKMAFAVCPPGTIATGGGVYADGVVPLFDFGEGNAWFAVTTDLTATADTFGASATCYNPRGRVAAQFRGTGGEETNLEQLRRQVTASR